MESSAPQPEQAELEAKLGHAFARPALLADKILEKMSDGQEWDTPTLRIALEYLPASTISTALRKMLAGGSIQLVRTVSRGSVHRHVYKRVAK